MGGLVGLLAGTEGGCAAFIDEELDLSGGLGWEVEIIGVALVADPEGEAEEREGKRRLW